MLVLSHRGYHVSLPENTLDAFQAAIEMQVDGIETDIRLTADGIPVLFHDHLIQDAREVSALSHAELNTATGLDVPTVEQALELPVPDALSFLWNLEVKTPAAIEQTIDIVSRYRSRRRMLVTSFWHPVVKEIGRRADVDCGLVVCHRPVEMRARPDWVPIHPRVGTLVWCWEFADAELIAQSAACGFKNLVYGVATPEEHARAEGWKLDGMITDRPEFFSARRLNLNDPNRRCAR
jgi:glycerophosphoryl diester phosphodiesterase